VTKQQIKEKRRLIKRRKTPTDNGKYVGIEIEMITRASGERIADLIIEQGLEKYCNVGTDGSIVPDRKPKLKKRIILKDGQPFTERYLVDAPFGRGIELRVMCKESELKFVLNRLQTVLTQAKAYVNNSCGLHVHIDMRHRDFFKVAKNLILKQKTLQRLVDKHRLDNQYCKPQQTLSDSFALMQEAFTGSKYKDINLSSFSERKTIEVRLHHGTIDTNEIYNWCKYLIHQVNNKPLTKGLKNYVQQRIKINAQNLG
jgi:hypothetical protein